MQLLNSGSATAQDISTPALVAALPIPTQGARRYLLEVRFTDLNAASHSLQMCDVINGVAFPSPPVMGVGGAALVETVTSVNEDTASAVITVEDLTDGATAASWEWTLYVVEEVGGGGGVLPFRVDEGAQPYITNGGEPINIEVAQNGSSTFAFQVTDSEDNPVDLAGHEVGFTAHDLDGVELFALSSEDAEPGVVVSIPAGGSVANLVTVEVGVAVTGNPYAGRYMLWDAQLADPLAVGAFTIKVSPIPPPPEEP